MMNIGMLWFDNDSKTGIEYKVERAANYYRNKYGKAPTLCYVHPSMLRALMVEGRSDGQPKNETSQQGVYSAAGIEIRTSRSVLPNHFWIGVNGKH